MYESPFREYKIVALDVRNTESHPVSRDVLSKAEQGVSTSSGPAPILAPRPTPSTAATFLASAAAI